MQLEKTPEGKAPLSLEDLKGNPAAAAQLTPRSHLTKLNAIQTPANRMGQKSPAQLLPLRTEKPKAQGRWET